MNIRDLIGPQLDKLQKNAIVAALVGGVLSIGGLLLNLSDARQWFVGYLVAFMFWLGVTTGSLAWLMIGHVTGGGWAIILRRPLEAAVRNLPLIFVLFVPILIAVWWPSLSHSPTSNPFYSWTNPEANWVKEGYHGNVGEYEHFKHLMSFKAPWLNPLGFTIRAVIYFGLWMLLGNALIKWSRQQNTSNDPEIARKLNTRSALGLLIYSLTITFASIDWVMSLTPVWFSSLFGVIFAVGQGLSTLALMTVLINSLAGDTEVVASIEPRYFRDLGNLHLAFTLLWAYTNISQFMLIWSGNLPEENFWYTVRTSWDNKWIVVGIFLVIGHFWFPFFCLLSSALKVRIQNLAKLSAWYILVRLVDLHFYIAPTFRGESMLAHPLALLSDIGLPIFIGGIWLYSWAAQLRNEELVPMADPRVEAARETIQSVIGTVPGGAVSHA